MGTITKKAFLFEEFVKEKEITSILENINESVDTELAEKFKTLDSEKEAAEAINALIDSKASFEDFFATLATLKQKFKLEGVSDELEPEFQKALNKMVDVYDLTNPEKGKLAKKIIEKIRKNKVNESETQEEDINESSKKSLVSEIEDLIKSEDSIKSKLCKELGSECTEISDIIEELKELDKEKLEELLSSIK